MKLVKIDDVYINIDQVTSIEFDAWCDVQIRVVVYFLIGRSRVFYRQPNAGETLSQVIDRFIDELQNKPVVEI